MTDGNYYMDGESFIHCKEHMKGQNDVSLILAEMINFGHGIGYYDCIPLVEDACDRRMVDSTKEEFEMIKNIYETSLNTIDKLNDLWFIPRWESNKAQQRGNI